MCGSPYGGGFKNPRYLWFDMTLLRKNISNSEVLIRIRLLLFVGVISIFASCKVQRQSISGIYVNMGSKYINDTLIIDSNKTYVQKLYNKKNDTLLAINKSTWEYDESGKSIDFYSFFKNENINPEDYSFTHVAEGYFGGADLPIKGDKIYLNFDIPIYYKKIKGIAKGSP